MKYKKYIVFAFNDGIKKEHGGIDDIFGSYDTLEEAKRKIIHMEFGKRIIYEASNVQIVDRDTWECLFRDKDR
jgi:hypothetical protein